MTTLRYVITDKATFSLGEQIFPKICHHIRIRHIGGAANAEITFAASGPTAQAILSPSGGTPYPQEIQMDSHTGYDRVRIKALGTPPDASVEVTAWT